MNYKYMDQLALCIKERYCEPSSDNYPFYVETLIGLLYKDDYKPTVLSKEEFNELHTLPLYRGYSIPEEEFDANKQDFAYGPFQKLFLSGNVYGAGLYFSDKESTARHYASTRNNIIKAKLAPGAKVFSIEKMRNFVENSEKTIRFKINLLLKDRLSSEDIEYFTQRVINMNEVMFVANMLDIDGIISDVEMYGLNYVIFNRDALVVNEEDFPNKKSDNTQPGEN